jgi:hypothetical protein
VLSVTRTVDVDANGMHGEEGSQKPKADPMADPALVAEIRQRFAAREATLAAS